LKKVIAQYALDVEEFCNKTKPYERYEEKRMLISSLKSMRLTLVLMRTPNATLNEVAERLHL
jgi:hypothetical protein